MISIEFKGIEQLTANLEVTKARTIQLRGLRAGGEVIAEAIRDRAPERADTPSGTALPPGALKHDVEVHASTKNTTVTVGFGKYTKHVARFVEFGHNLVRGSKKNGSKSIGHVPAHPFIRPALDDSSDTALQVIKQTITDSISKAANGQKAQAS